MIYLDDLIKEVYAKFGLAYYYSECVHKELCHIYVFADIPSINYITRPRLEEKMKFAYSKTLGQITELVYDFLPDDVKKDIIICIDKRNYLAHNYWLDKVHLMTYQDGLESMLIFLEENRSFFDNLNNRLENITLSKIKELGLFENYLISLNDVLSGKPPNILPDMRFPKKYELIINAWDVKTENGKSTLIFETDDGALWQPSEVGLSWTYHKKNSDWIINESIQKHLPSKVIARPGIDSMWNYSFKLKHSVIIWFKKDDIKQTVTWGLRNDSASA